MHRVTSADPFPSCPALGTLKTEPRWKDILATPHLGPVASAGCSATTGSAAALQTTGRLRLTMGVCNRGEGQVRV